MDKSLYEQFKEIIATDQLISPEIVQEKLRVPIETAERLMELYESGEGERIEEMLHGKEA